MFLSTAHTPDAGSLLLDTQASVHLIKDHHLLQAIHTSARPITVQGITRDKVHVSEEGIVPMLGTTAYYCPSMAANIISYSRLMKTHRCTYDSKTDIFTATPRFMGPLLTFTNVRGHYVIAAQPVLSAYSTFTETRGAHLTKRQRLGATAAYEFIGRLGYISYSKAAEAIQHGTIANLGFTRADLVNAQQLYGYPAAYQLGHGTQHAKAAGELTLLPIKESPAQELQIDTFFFLGNVFFLSISVLLGLIIVTHLGPGSNTDTSSDTAQQKRGDKVTSGSKAKSGQSLLAHLELYASKGFTINRVTSDGEPAIKALRDDIEAQGIELNILGHGSHAPHAESAIRHVKNMARSTVHSLGYPLPPRWTCHLIAFIVCMANLIPKLNSMGSRSAYSNFTGRIPSYPTIAPFPFGITGFLQRAKTANSNSAAPRADYGIWIGTTRTSSGTHKMINLDSLQIITGDKFQPAPLTAAAVTRITTLATGHITPALPPTEPLLTDHTPRYDLDPDRGVDTAPAPTDPAEHEESSTPFLTSADLPATAESLDSLEVSDLDQAPESIPEQSSPPDDEEDTAQDTQATSEAPLTADSGAITAAEDLAAVRATQRYNLRSSDRHTEQFIALTTAEAQRTYGVEATRKSNVEEITNCLTKSVWDPVYSQNAYPSKMIIKEKKLPCGRFDKLKSRIVGGGHRQDAALFKECDISSPTVALTSMLAGAAIAAHLNHHVMTVDFKAAYLNATMTGEPVDMLLPSDITTLLVEMEPSYQAYVRTDKKLAVRLKKALYGFKQSAMLWYRELAGSLEELGFKRNPYDTCSFIRTRGPSSIDRILVYVDDLFISSDTEAILDEIVSSLRSKYGEVTSHKGKEHNYLGIAWDFKTAGQVTLSMHGYVEETLRKYGVHVRHKTPATDNLFNSDPGSPPLTAAKQELFHSATMTLHYLAKRVRPDILTATSFCATRVLHPTEEDEEKLDRILGYLLGTKTQTLILRIGDSCEVRAYVDSSFGLYPDGKSITGAVIMLGNAPIFFKSSKQKIVTRSSTESELVGISDTLSQILWAREFLIAQGLRLGPAILFQDNMSTIFLANKGRSTSERTRHIKIRYFFITHYVDNKEIKIEYMPTTRMIADIFTKSLHGTLFKKLSAAITGRCLI